MEEKTWRGFCRKEQGFAVEVRVKGLPPMTNKFWTGFFHTELQAAHAVDFTNWYLFRHHYKLMKNNHINFPASYNSSLQQALHPRLRPLKKLRSLILPLHKALFCFSCLRYVARIAPDSRDSQRITHFLQKHRKLHLQYRQFPIPPDESSDDESIKIAQGLIIKPRKSSAALATRITRNTRKKNDQSESGHKEEAVAASERSITKEERKDADKWKSRRRKLLIEDDDEGQEEEGADQGQMTREEKGVHVEGDQEKKERNIIMQESVEEDKTSKKRRINVEKREEAGEKDVIKKRKMFGANKKRRRKLMSTDDIDEEGEGGKREKKKRRKLLIEEDDDDEGREEAEGADEGRMTREEYKGDKKIINVDEEEAGEKDVIKKRKMFGDEDEKHEKTHAAIQRRSSTRLHGHQHSPQLKTKMAKASKWMVVSSSSSSSSEEDSPPMREKIKPKKCFQKNHLHLTNSNEKKTKPHATLKENEETNSEDEKPLKQVFFINIDSSATLKNKRNSSTVPSACSRTGRRGRKKSKIPTILGRYLSKTLVQKRASSSSLLGTNKHKNATRGDIIDKNIVGAHVTRKPRTSTSTKQLHMKMDELESLLEDQSQDLLESDQSFPSQSSFNNVDTAENDEVNTQVEIDAQNEITIMNQDNEEEDQDVDSWLEPLKDSLRDIPDLKIENCPWSFEPF